MTSKPLFIVISRVFKSLCLANFIMKNNLIRMDYINLIYIFRVTFPYELDLNSFIEATPNQESPNGEEDVGVSVKCDDNSTTDSGTLEDEFLPCECATAINNHSNNHDQDDDEGLVLLFIYSFFIFSF